MYTEIGGFRIDEIDKRGEFEFEIESDGYLLYKYLTIEEAKKLIEVLQENIDKYER